jgi:tryptophan synthase beta chain
MFHAFLKDSAVALVGIESAGDGIDTPRHAATLGKGRPGVLHGSYSTLLQDENGQVLPTHTISAGLDYPGVGPEHSYLKQSGRVTYTSALDIDALAAFVELCRLEGIIPALESSFALAGAKQLATTMSSDQIMVVNLSGRGDKDLAAVLQYLNADSPKIPGDPVATPQGGGRR